ncbi:MAG TPA: hypothetical protein VE641_10930, partial [Chthoniobacterales bacterium]|nr:hypothetical protein [Chthoniobacterales bacterium]
EWATRRDGVPEGLNDGQPGPAVPDQDRAQERNRPGYGMMLYRESIKTFIKTRQTHPNHTVPKGTDPLLAPFLAINCQATIIQSLRDAHSPRRPFAASHIRSPAACHYLLPKRMKTP